MNTLYNKEIFIFQTSPVFIHIFTRNEQTLNMTKYSKNGFSNIIWFSFQNKFFSAIQQHRLIV